MTIITRFAPSPTGFLHIGGARTALFNWLYSRRHQGVFRLRIEDTDRQRSTPEAIEAIIEGLKWLGLDWDDEIVYQFARAERHAAVAKQLVDKGLAYHCYASPEELDAMREAQRAAGKPIRYDGRWRDRPATDRRPNVPPVVRIKAPQAGETIIHDKVQGDVRFSNDVLDDFILLRSDGNPTYMLSVVVDDFDMGVTHIIRGKDLRSSTHVHILLQKLLGLPQPVYRHHRLVLGEDGKRLAKRDAAATLRALRAAGVAPAEIRGRIGLP